MKITATKREEVLKKRAENQARWDEYQSDQNERRRRLYVAEHDVMAPLKAQLEEDLSRFNLLEFDVNVSRGFNWRSEEGKDFIEVRIRCNENTKFQDTSALSWSYDVSLDEKGEVRRETSSWSGLKACTAEQIDSLKQTVAALEELNSYDWKSLISVKFPEYKEFYDGAMERPDSVDYRESIAQATMEDMLGQDAIIKINGWGENYTSRYYYAKVIGQTANQWKLQLVSNYTVDMLASNKFKDEETRRAYERSLLDSLDESKSWNTVRARKINIHPVEDENGEPIIYEISDLVER